MIGLWPDDSLLPGFQSRSLAFMHKVQAVSEKLMTCLARALGFKDDFFVQWHDASLPNSQSTLRLLHYFATPKITNGEVYHRAGAHADWGFLTLLFQKPGQSGLEICPGREVVTEFGHGDAWTKVNFDSSTDIICE
jgi:isopenicillin N synthase-like dioxygenase